MKPLDPIKKRRVTLKLVADRAGVHASTASRALNPVTRSMVLPSVAQKVLDAAQELGYHPDPVAASLRTGRSKLAAILVPDISNSVFAPILSGASERLATEGYTVIVADVGSDKDKQLNIASGLMARRVDGFILATVSKDDPLVAFCLEQNIPAVLVNRAEAQSRLSSVVSDDELGMQMAVDHLVSLTHKIIGHIAGPAQHSTGYLRRRGFGRAMARHGLTENSPCQIAKSYSRHEGAHAARRLLDSHPQVTAIVAANDLLALGVYDVFRERGINCPAEISVVGHNDMQLVDMIEPPLTTIRIDHHEMGRQAAELLRQVIENPDKAKHNVTLQPILIVRSSTAAPRKPKPQTRSER
ncbi:LacI family DNA-binding transcriptional regulator [Pseudorhodoplanes sinuspersici]|uniref:LacI family transcriptional regulator n=1 Tax=Pseudorhodoplanes sinuspersici TaxID=1235591 RepID=A0A1W6ZTC3_9HYPH|nr:LacI family DNA-binding transcriptional regulator [Pseudorhodoplanes sinuspersici]ARQ00546.1 LacI family transcriptional regulator [Pseudorhodoplanes sinuspersici]RKE67259.1 LacI family transcriptional regulator [Pseudorhodoplanes sinuspersici]